jgi:CRISPR-associated protein Cmr2
MTQSMLMFSLGPVQPFIAQARKTRDLWIGSLLLSRLMEAAMAGITEQIIFPTRQVVEGIPDIPNKYVALFSSPGEAQRAAEGSTARIKAQWEHISDTVWNNVIGIDDETTSAIWHRQTDFDHLFEIYWAIVPREEEGLRKEYGVWLEETESLFAARKRLRDFKAQDEPGEKSSISGEREILRSHPTRQESNKAFWIRIAKKLSPRDINQEGEERLDAIDTIKRFAMNAHALQPEKPFPSTSSIATATFVEKLLDCDPQHDAFRRWEAATATAGKRLLTKPQEAIREEIPYLFQHATEAWRWLLQRDGDLYFPAMFTPERLKKDYGITSADDVIRQGKDALGKLFTVTDTCHITRPTPYYAVMQMDGDNMGVLLSGTRDEKEHQAISRALSDFAHNTAPNDVEQRYPARLVYAGGDDVLALAPLVRDTTEANRGQPLSILNLADELQIHYQERLEAALPSSRTSQDQNEERILKGTASMGIAVAHHYTALSYVLRSARAAEDAAKRRYGRNALVITILRRSGEQTQVGCHWRYPDPQNKIQQPIELFSRFLSLFKDDLLSPKCVFILLEEAPALVGLDRTAQESEVRRVLLRQLKPRTNEEKNNLQKEIKEQLAPHLVALAEKMDEDERAQATEDDQKECLAVDLHSTRRRYGLVEVFGWLLVMTFLARKDQEQE